MKLDAVRFGHATAIVGAGAYIVCWLLIGSTPVFYRGMMGSWWHGFDINALPMRSLSMGTGIYGLVTLVAFSWVVGFALAQVYNSLGKK